MIEVKGTAVKVYDPSEVFTGPNRDLGMGLTARLMTITPSVAEHWLTKVHPRNRNRTESRVVRYAADMEAGKFTLNDQCISFDEEDFMVNGAHRCSACVRSGKPFVAIVLRGLPKRSFRNLDGVKTRTTDDNARIAGLDVPSRTGATVRNIFYGLQEGNRGVTDEEVFAFMETHGDSVRFAHRVLPRGKMAISITRAVVARAHAYGKSQERLEQFGKVLTTGVMVPGDEAAVALRNYILEGRKPVRSVRMILYGMVEGALVLFLEGERNKKLQPVRNERFPILQGEAVRGKEEREEE